MFCENLRHLDTHITGLCKNIFISIILTLTFLLHVIYAYNQVLNLRLDYMQRYTGETREKKNIKGFF